MDFFFAVAVFLFGAAIGSFLNVVILRTLEGRAVTGRSACPACGHALTAFELVPLVSFALQRGRCRACKASISLQYPLVEAATGFALLALYLKTAMLMPAAQLAALIYYGAIAALLIVIFVYDLYTTLIPNEFVYPFVGLALAAPFVDFVQFSVVAPTPGDLIAGPLLFLPFFLLWWYSSGTWMGLGDGKLALGIGWVLGLAAGFSAVLLSFVLGAAVSLGIMGLQRLGIERLQLFGTQLTMKSEVPFAPFLIVGIALVFLFEIDALALTTRATEYLLFTGVV